jgi:GNAT superfamily N-acetyltransferase
MLFLDMPLARRIESAEALAAVEGAKTLERLRPGVGAAVEQIAGGHAVFCGINSPVTQAVGMGLSGPVDAVDVDRLEDFYFSRGDAVRVELCPLADMSLVGQFGKRGYRATEFSNVMARPLEPTESWPSPAPGITIDAVPSDQSALWTQTVAQGFAEHFPVTPELLEVMHMFALGPNASCFLALVDGQIAGGGCLSVREGVGGLFGASTLPAFRNRGVQTALLHARLSRAAAAGCNLAVSIALPASISQRNILRQGFHVLYTRVKFENALPA